MASSHYERHLKNEEKRQRAKIKRARQAVVMILDSVSAAVKYGASPADLVIEHSLKSSEHETFDTPHGPIKLRQNPRVPKGQFHVIMEGETKAGPEDEAKEDKEEPEEEEAEPELEGKKIKPYYYTPPFF